MKDKVILNSDHIGRVLAWIALLLTMLMRGWNEVEPTTGSRRDHAAGLRMRGSPWQLHPGRRRAQSHAECRQPADQGSREPARGAALRAGAPAGHSIGCGTEIPARGAPAPEPDRGADGTRHGIGAGRFEPFHRIASDFREPLAGTAPARLPEAAPRYRGQHRLPLGAIRLRGAELRPRHPLWPARLGARHLQLSLQRGHRTGGQPGAACRASGRIACGYRRQSAAASGDAAQAFGRNGSRQTTSSRTAPIEATASINSRW